MNNVEKKWIIDHGFQPYGTPTKKRHLIEPVITRSVDKRIASIAHLFDQLPMKDGMTLSFHHHLRNGDYVLNAVLSEIKKRQLKNITIAASAIFPVHEPMVELIKNGQITDIYTNYINGPVAKAVSQGYLKGLIVMDSHGGRPRAIESGELKIDVAFIAVPCADHMGNGNGIEGPSACGALGYAIADMTYASYKVLLTDYLVDEVKYIEIESQYIDAIIVLDHIGDAKGIVSGTTQPTKNPVQLKIAKDTVLLMDALGCIKDGFSFQSGAGGISIAVAQYLKNHMQKHHIKGLFASGGITKYLVEMLEENLFAHLYDVQCFDLKAVESYRDNAEHLPMSASKYANPDHKDAIVKQLDVVILGATEVDLSYNVNVTTDSNGQLMGGSGGHSDTAHGAKVTIITTNLMKSRLPIIKENVFSITTPGDDVDCIVTERGIAIHPKRTDLLAKVAKTNLNIVPIEALYNQAIQMTGKPEQQEKEDRIIGLIRYPDGTIIDCLYQVEGDV
ncbi:MAG: citrate lyase subunit alpha [Acholeplasmataceae bacterium]